MTIQLRQTDVALVVAVKGEQNHTVGVGVDDREAIHRVLLSVGHGQKDDLGPMAFVAKMSIQTAEELLDQLADAITKARLS